VEGGGEVLGDGVWGVVGEVEGRIWGGFGWRVEMGGWEVGGWGGGGREGVEGGEGGGG